MGIYALALCNYVFKLVGQAQKEKEKEKELYLLRPVCHFLCKSK